MSSASLYREIFDFGAEVRGQTPRKSNQTSSAKWIFRESRKDAPDKLCVWRRNSLRSSGVHHSKGNLEHRLEQWHTGQQRGYIRVSELSDRKQYRQVLKAVDTGNMVYAWNLILRPDKHSFAK